MKNFLPFLILACIFSTELFAQTLTINKARPASQKSKQSSSNFADNTTLNEEKCGFALWMQQAKQRGYDESAYETELKKLIQNKIAKGTSNFTGLVTIPVIFHLVHRTADAVSDVSPNLSAAKIQAQVDQLNLDYANLSGSAYGVAADVQIKFCLAMVDTVGKILAEPGIDRIDGQANGWNNTNNMRRAALITFFEGTIKPATIWDPNSYFNVWSAAMDNSSLLGYASFPGLSTLQGLDNSETDAIAGVVINWESIGSVANPGVSAPYGFGRTLTHESGHFFGLRHINGDVACGNDFCNDTPTQDVLTGGCPAPGTLNNCTPSGPKMFENYMDYSNDACLNTFTSNQALRCHTVMDNSPRRTSLALSKACLTRAANSIGFSSSAAATPLTVLETGMPGACPNTKNYTVNLYVSSLATGNATVTFTSSGTATLNNDFTISPSSVSYSNNDASVKTITITVTDDQAAESAETIVVGYTISGTGVVAAPERQAFTIKIIDDDAATVFINYSNPTQTLLNQNFDASASVPSGWTTQVFGDGTTVPNEWVVGADGGNGTAGNAAFITENTSTKPNTYNIANESDAYLYSPLIDATGLKNLNVSFKWRCVGELDWDEGYIGFIPEGQALTAANVLYFDAKFSDQTGANPAAVAESFNLPSLFDNKKFYFVFKWLNDNNTGASPAFTIDDVFITGKTFSVATTADADTSFIQGSGQNANYYSINAAAPFEPRILATINGLNQNIGCIGASLNITNPGTGLTLLSTSTGLYQRSNKVINLTPAAANSTATYQAIFYFTTAELVAWGANVPNLKILKVADGVNLASTLTPANAQIFTPVVDDQRATKGYVSYSINATGGFSQFLLVSPAIAVPVTLISFEARAATKNIVLNWSTAAEINNKGFVIERSLNGIDFEKTGWVDGRLNSSTTNTYQYIDNFVQPGILYFYRLRQTDIDGRQTLTEIRQAKIKDASMYVSISPNPAKNLLTIFTSGSKGFSNINLVNTRGQLVKSWKKINTLVARQTLDISNVAAGIYMLQIITAERNFAEKLIVY